MRRGSALALAALGTLALASCARRTPPAAGAPEWSGPGSGAFETGSDRRLVGLGVAAPAEGEATAAMMAQARARAELTVLADTLVDAIVRAGGGDDDDARALRRLAQGLVDSSPAWEGPEGLVYATATLEIPRLLDALVPAGVLGPALAAAAPGAVATAFRALRRAGVRPPAMPAAVSTARVAADGICLARLDGAPTEPGAQSCILNDALAQWQGLLRYPCAGGEAEALFGDTRLTGTVERGEVALSLERVFHFTDGCSWTSRQRISGRLDTGVLGYRYEETHAPGERGCDDPCAVDREVRVAR